MRACKSYQRQIALMAVDALSATEKPRVLQHVNECAECAAYRKQLQGIVRVYKHDAERAIEPAQSATFRAGRKGHRETQPIRWTAWLFGVPKPALAAICLLMLGLCWLFFREVPRKPSAPSAQTTVAPAKVQTQNTLISSTASIANTRHLADKDLEEWLQMPESPKPAEFVFSIRMRQEGQ